MKPGFIFLYSFVLLFCTLIQKDLFCQSNETQSNRFKKITFEEADGTHSLIIDNYSKLMWAQHKIIITIYLDYERAAIENLEYMNHISFAGFRNWRLPSPIELSGLNNNGEFLEVFSGPYATWTSEGAPKSERGQRQVYTVSGVGKEGEKLAKSYTAHAGGLLAVRSFTTEDLKPLVERMTAVFHKEPGFRKAVFGSQQVVIDTANNLMWAQNDEMLSEITLPYKRAKAPIVELNQSSYAGFRDWRVPKLIELITLKLKQPRQIGQGYSTYLPVMFKHPGPRMVSAFWANDSTIDEAKHWIFDFADGIGAPCKGFCAAMMVVRDYK